MKGDRISADLAKSDVFATITFKVCNVSYLCHYKAEKYEILCKWTTSGIPFQKMCTFRSGYFDKANVAH